MAVVAAAAVASLLWPTVAGASVGDDPLDCGATVVDTSGELDTAAVADAAASVEGAQVVVRGYGSVPDGDLVAVVDDLIVSCFGDASETDLALFAFSVGDRQADVVLAPLLPGEAVATDLRTTMTEPFPAGGFTDGVLAAIDQLAGQVGAPLDGDAADGEGAGAGEGAGGADDDGGTGDGEGAGGNADPADDGAGDGDLGGLVQAGAAAALVGVGAAGGVGLWRARRRRLADDRRAFESELASPQLRVGALREQGHRLDAQSELWTKMAEGRTATVLAEHRSALRSAANHADHHAALVAAATPDGIGAAARQQLDMARQRLADLVAALDRHETAIGDLLTFGAHLDRLRVSLPAKRELLATELAEARSLAAQRREEGWKVERSAADLDRVDSTMGSVDLSDLVLDLLTLSDRLEDAEAALFAARHDLESLPDRPAAITRWHDLQRTAVEAERERSHAVETRLRTVGAGHDPESWDWATRNPARARNHLATVATVAAPALDLAAAQDFDEAGRTLERAGLELIAADELLDQIDNLLVDLEQARAEAPGIVAESRQVLDQFEAFVRHHGSDLSEEIQARPRRLRAAIDGLEADLASARPNYLRVAETAEHLNCELDEVLATAEAQHERMEALRREADREIARARRNLRRAREALGWELFPSSQTREIETLENRLSRLPSNPQARIEAARRIADQATALQDRIIHRRRGGGYGGWGGGWGGGGTWGGSGGGSGGISIGGGGSGGFSIGGGGSGGRSFGGGRSSGSW